MRQIKQNKERKNEGGQVAFWLFAPKKWQISSFLFSPLQCHPRAVLTWLVYQALFLASSFVITYILIKVRDDEKYVYTSMEHKTFYDLSTGIYWVTFVTFLPVLLYFWKRVLSFYIQMVKGTIHTAYNIEYNNNFISNSSSSSSGVGHDDEGQSVAFAAADSFVRSVTLDVEP
jgi:hypothetical protein